MTTSRFTKPKVYLTGYTATNMAEIRRYLQDSGQEDFIKTLHQAEEQGVRPAEALISMYAKLCYKSLVVGHNANISQVRDIPGNIAGCFKQGHGSVFEHVMVNFLVTDCSRVFTHELVRHRIGTAFSQTSGRFCRIVIGGTQIIWDPILDGCQEIFAEALGHIEKAVYLAECKKGLRMPPVHDQENMTPNPEMCFQRGGADGDVVEGTAIEYPDLMWVPDNSFDFAKRKKITSAIRRIAPNGQSNEIGFSCNIRSLRHTILMRTGRHSEWEIRYVFEQIYLLSKEKFPLLFTDAKEEVVDGLIEVTGMRMQPYEVDITAVSKEDFAAEAKRRGFQLHVSDGVSAAVGARPDVVGDPGREEQGAKP